jgi:hypothetical protein
MELKFKDLPYEAYYRVTNSGDKLIDECVFQKLDNRCFHGPSAKCVQGFYTGFNVVPDPDDIVERVKPIEE